MSKKSEIEKKSDAPLAQAGPSPYDRPFEMEGADELEKMIPRLVIHQGQNSKKFWGDHPMGTLMDSVTQEVFPKPLHIVPIGINWTEYIRYGEKMGDPIIYRTRNKADVPEEDLAWQDNEPPACTTFWNFVCLVAGRELPIAISVRNSEKNQKKFGGALFQFEKIRAAGKKGPGLYAIETAEATNSKGTWHFPKLQSLGNPPDDLAAMALMFYQTMHGKHVEADIEGTRDVGSEAAAYDPNND